MIDKLLKLFGLVRRSEYEALRRYTDSLAVAAIKKGVRVLFDDGVVEDEKIEGPVFIHGNRAVFSRNCVSGSTKPLLVVAPGRTCLIRDNTFREE